MLPGATVAVRPIEGVRRRLTFPLNPLSPVTVKVELPVNPARMVILVGLATMAKSTTWTLTIVVWVRNPLELVMVTV
jgi:hypothetical protein